MSILQTLGDLVEVNIASVGGFKAVVTTGSITKASRMLKLSQPSISQNLNKIEETLGVQLLVRNKKGTSILTPAGAVLA